MTRASLTCCVCAWTALLVGCATNPAPRASVAPPKPFDFTMHESCVTAGSANVTLAVVAPQWSEEDSQSAGQPGDGRRALYAEFSDAMKNDFFEMLSCKGISTKGPFRAFDDMVFPDRQGSDLVIIPEMNVRIATSSEAVQPDVGVGTVLVAAVLRSRSEPQSFVVKGTASLSGEVTLSLRESITNTRMWTRRIPIAPVSFEFAGTKVYPARQADHAGALATSDPAFLSELRPRMLSLYETVLSQASNMINATEMQMVKRQSLAPRGRAVHATPP